MMEESMLTSDVISRKYLSEERMEIRFSTSSGELRLGRIFNIDEDSEYVHSLFNIITDLNIDNVIIPDKLEFLEDGSFCLSIPESPMSPFSGPQLSIKQLFAPIRAMHERGWVHHSLTPNDFVMKNDDLHLISFMDTLFAPDILSDSELTFGIPSPFYYDLYLLGRCIRYAEGHLWSGDEAEAIDGLCSNSISKRIDSIQIITGDKYILYGDNSRNIKIEKPGSVLLLHGGSWRERDRSIALIATEAIDKGWIIACLRCTPAESHRPLPGHFPIGEASINSGFALLRELFPAVSGVRRLLIVDQIEFASPDLLSILGEISRSSSIGLTLVITSSLRDEFEGITVDRVIEIVGEPENAVEWQLHRLPSEMIGKGYPVTAGSRSLYRCVMSENLPEKLSLTQEELYREGAYRVLCESNDPIRRDDGFPIRSLLKLNRFEEVLKYTDDIYMRAEANYGLGIHAEAKILALKAWNEEPGNQERALLLAHIYFELRKFDISESILSEIHGTESILLLARVLNSQDRGSEAIPVLQNAIESANDIDKVRLWCSEVSIQMRIGNYRKAKELAFTAVEIAFLLSDSALIIMSLRERGRINEILGDWNDSLDDYRLSLSFSAENPDIGYPYVVVDLFILEIKTGNLKAAEDTFDTLSAFLTKKATPSNRQLLNLLIAHRGALLGLGALSIENASKAVAIASLYRMNKEHARSMLYMGQLHIQIGDDTIGFRSLNQARAEAGLLGDRHLLLTIDLASFLGSKDIGFSQIVMEAGELGLEIEKLEARAIASENPAEYAASLINLLNVPSPLKAIEIANKNKLPASRKLSKRILIVFESISGMLQKEERATFLENHAYLTGELENMFNTNTIELLHASIKITADWITSHSSEGFDLAELAGRLDLVSLNNEPSGKHGEIKICDDPPLYASGDNLSLIEVLGPVIASLSAIQPAEVPLYSPSTDLFPEIVGNSHGITELKMQMKRVSGSNLPVLVIGETGTGKELVARGIHSESLRKDHPLVSVDCGAIAPNLLESELFGASSGAYTGSQTDRQGLMEAANRGSLFLDEVGNLTPILQVKLLRALETGIIRRLGETKERNIDCRIISATNTDLNVESSGTGFRSDLYFRIAVLVIRIPPLRDRVDDIPFLIDHFKRTSLVGEEISKFTREALRKLSRYSWPGNIRELRNVVQRAFLFHSGDTIDACDISFESYLENNTLPGARTKFTTLENIISEHIFLLVNACDGNKTEASRILKCDPKTVQKYYTIHENKKGVTDYPDRSILPSTSSKHFTSGDDSQR